MSFDHSEDPSLARMDRAFERFCAAQAELVEAAAALEEQSPDDFGEPLETRLAARYREGSGTVAEWVRLGVALRSLPAIREAHREGHLSWGQVRPLSRLAAPDTDEALSMEAQDHSPAKLWREANRHQRAERQEQAHSEHQLRRVWMRWDDDRVMLQMHAELPAEQGARVERALTRRAEDVVLEDDLPPYDRAGARLADALTELVTESQNKPPVETLVIHADARVVTGTSKPGDSLLGEAASGIQITDQAVRRLACDAGVEWVLEADGRAVGIGRKGRVVPGWVRRQLEHRDPECRFEGCSRKRWLVIHHVIPWARGGRTDLDNLIRVCSFHHRQLHEGGWTVTGHPDRDLRFHDPGGRQLGLRPEKHQPQTALQSR